MCVHVYASPRRKFRPSTVLLGTKLCSARGTAPQMDFLFPLATESKDSETFQGPSDSARSGVPSQDGAISPQRKERVPTVEKELHTDLQRLKVVWFEIHDPTQGSKDRHRRLVEDSGGFAWLLSLIFRPSKCHLERPEEKPFVLCRRAFISPS